LGRLPNSALLPSPSPNAPVHDLPLRRDRGGVHRAVTEIDAGEAARDCLQNRLRCHGGSGRASVITISS